MYSCHNVYNIVLFSCRAPSDNVTHHALISTLLQFQNIQTNTAITHFTVGGAPDICTLYRAQGWQGAFMGARTYFARQFDQFVLNLENMGHLQFWKFRCSVQCQW